ncbi:MAG: ATP-binding protein, partial [Paracoccaceae bacterium]
MTANVDTHTTSGGPRLSWLGRLNRMRIYVFSALILTLLLPFSVLFVRIEQTAFEREMFHVEQGHLNIALNLAESLSRYAVDMKATFDFLLSAHGDGGLPGDVERLMAGYHMRYLAILDAGDVPRHLIAAIPSDLPPQNIIEALRDESAGGATIISSVQRVDDQAFLFVVKRMPDGGMAFAPFSTDYIVRVQKAIAFGERGHSMIVDHTGKVLAHPNEGWQKISKDASPLSVVQLMLAGKTGVAQFFSPPLQADMVAGYTFAEETGWGVMVPQPIEELVVRAETEAWILVRVLVVLFVLAVLGSWFLAAVIETPLRKFATTVAAIRAGDLTARVPAMPRLSPNETRDLRTTFNGLMDKLETESDLLRASLEAAQEANAAKSRFVAVLSHEMRTPLNGIMATLDLLRQTDMTESQARYLKLLDASSDILLHHVRDVLDITRLGSGEIKIEPSTFNVCEMVNEIAAVYRPTAARNGNKLTPAFQGPLPCTVISDRHKLRQVVENLVGNAIKFTRDGEILINVEQIGADWLEITVMDTGRGIAPEDYDRIFEPFTILDAEFGRTTEGTGLGLSIVKGFVQAMGGEISVSSTVGRGSQFRVRVPVEVADVAAIAPPKAIVDTRAPNTPAARILVVEDNDINAVVLREMLEQMGHRVELADSGESGLMASAHETFDLILMDISMPGMDGTEVARKVRAGGGPNQATSIIAQTAHARPEDRDLFEASGMQDVLLKPITRTKLETLLAKHLNGNILDEAPAPIQTEDLLDLALLDELIDTMGQNPTRNIAKRCEDELRALQASLTTYLAAPAETDAEALAKQAHKTAGTCALLGAMALHSTLKSVETAVRDEQRDQVAKLTLGFEDMIAST